MTFDEWAENHNLTEYEYLICFQFLINRRIAFLLARIK